MSTAARDALAALLAATNTHDFANVSELIAEDAVYFFGDATLVGREAVGAYFTATWDAIRDERYWAEEIRWVLDTEDAAVAVYRFRWTGVVDGQPASGSGRGTNTFARTPDGRWLLTHEHLTADPLPGPRTTRETPVGA